MATTTLTYNGRSSKARRALSALLETGLFTVSEKPNKKTMEAIKEARSGKYAGIVDTSSMEAFVKSIMQ